MHSRNCRMQTTTRTFQHAALRLTKCKFQARPRVHRVGAQSRYERAVLAQGEHSSAGSQLSTKWRARRTYNHAYNYLKLKTLARKGRPRPGWGHGGEAFPAPWEVRDTAHRENSCDRARFRRSIGLPRPEQSRHFALESRFRCKRRKLARDR